jgi:glutathione S-transferase
MTTDQLGLTLYTFAMSHFSEKVRWVLSTCQVPYREVCMTPALHVLPALWMGGRGSTTLPILREDRLNRRKSCVQDSTRILLWLDERHGPLDLLPQGPELRDECLSIEDRFDDIGQDVARFLYADGFRHDEKILRMWVQHAKPWEASFVTRGYPLIKWLFRRRLGMGPRARARSEHRILQAMAWLEGRLSDGRTYLVGSRLTVADITAAALLAPLACPSQHPVYGDPEYIQLLRSQGGAWRLDRPALVWVRKLYDLHRGQIQWPLAA